MPTSTILKIFFTTDIHGSNVCFRKLLNVASSNLKPDIIILGGDITGKFMIPILYDPTTLSWSGGPYEGKTFHFDTQSELDIFLTELSNKGAYPYVCQSDDFKRITYSKETAAEKLAELQKERIKEWIKLAQEKLKDWKGKFYINTGNDDGFFIDPILKDNDTLILSEDKIITLPNGMKLISLGWSNVTPWKCEREASEDKLNQMITKKMEGISDYHNCIFNFHCPPINTKLDNAPTLNKDFKPSIDPFGTSTTNVGSTAVRKAIEIFKPEVSLHGHIHESPAIDEIGNTVICNPGSEYWTGRLNGAFLIFKGTKLQEIELTREIINRADKANDSEKVVTGLKFAQILRKLLTGI